MLQRIRDEAHRFANTFHQERRSKRMTKSALDNVPGLGETRRKRLLKEVGGVGKVKQASREELRALPWLPNAVADAIHDRFHAVPGPAFVEPALDEGLAEDELVADDAALDDLAGDDVTVDD
jgi:excinuclease ABC subunit C